MEYQNVTLSIPKEVLKKAKTLAIEQVMLPCLTISVSLTYQFFQQP
jgi:hypothetical protein